jgi:hypothetical protein
LRKDRGKTYRVLCPFFEKAGRHSHTGPIEAFWKEAYAQCVRREGERVRKKGYIALQIISAEGSHVQRLEWLEAVAGIRMHNSNFATVSSRGLRSSQRKTT